MDGAQREEQAAVCVTEEEKGGCLQGMVNTVVSILQVRTITPGPYTGGLFCCWELGRKMWSGARGRPAGDNITAVWEKIRPPLSVTQKDRFICLPRSVPLLVLTFFTDSH